MKKVEIIQLKNILDKNYLLVGGCDVFQMLLKEIEKVVIYDVDVLLCGESGVGKEIVAKTIHSRSKRSEAPFVAVNLTGIPTSLIDSLLFGHEKGTFTGADANKIGFFEQADGGTLFIDEMGSLPLEFQVKLLRVIETRTLQPLGSTKAKKVNIRVIYATNKDLEKEVEEGRFRMDLYQRISVFPISIPSLRERKEDIPSLVNHFIEIFNKEHKMNIVTIDEEAMEIMKNFSWEGNVRQLKNVILKIMIDCSFEGKDMIYSESLPEYLTNYSGKKKENSCPVCQGELDLNKIKKFLLWEALRESRGNIKQASLTLGISRKCCHNWACEYFGSIEKAKKLVET